MTPLEANHWCVEVVFFDVDAHEPCTFGGDNTVEEDLGGHVGNVCAAIAGEGILLPPTVRRMRYGSSFSGR